MLQMPTQGSTQWDALAHVMWRGLDLQRLLGRRPDRVRRRALPRHRELPRELRRPRRAARPRPRPGPGQLPRTARPSARSCSTPRSPPRASSCARATCCSCAPATWRSGGPCPRTMTRTRTSSPRRASAATRCRGCTSTTSRRSPATTSASSPGPGGSEDRALPVHVACLVDLGLPLGELWDLDALAADCAEDGAYEFLLVAPPLYLPGCMGSPLNPIAAEVSSPRRTTSSTRRDRGPLVDGDVLVRGGRARARAGDLDVSAVPARARDHVVRHLRLGAGRRGAVAAALLPHLVAPADPAGRRADTLELPNGLSLRAPRAAHRLPGRLRRRRAIRARHDLPRPPPAPRGRGRAGPPRPLRPARARHRRAACSAASASRSTASRCATARGRPGARAASRRSSPTATARPRTARRASTSPPATARTAAPTSCSPASC